MIKYQCLACETIAYTSATGDEPRPAAAAAPSLPDLVLPDLEEVPINSSVQAVRSAEGLREWGTEKN